MKIDEMRDWVRIANINPLTFNSLLKNEREIKQALLSLLDKVEEWKKMTAKMMAHWEDHFYWDCCGGDDELQELLSQIRDLGEKC